MPSSLKKWLPATVRLTAFVSTLLVARGVCADEPPPTKSPMPREPLVFVVDPKLSMEPSVRTLDSLGQVVFRFEDALPGIEIDQSTLPGKVLAFVGRGLRLLFLDEPLAQFATTVTHEVGGHGARAREFGFKPTFLFYLPGIYRNIFSPDDHEAAGAYTSYQTTGVVDGTRDTLGSLGGLESQYTQAWWINARIVKAQGWVHHSDLLMYGASKLPYADSFFSSKTLTRNASSSGNDVSAYVTNLQDRSNGWRNEDRRRITLRLRAGYLWNFADPTLLYAIWGGVIAPLYRGQRVSQMPLPTIGNYMVYPSPRFNLTPFGAEQAIDVFVAHADGSDNRLLDVYARVGTSGLAEYWGAGARLLGVELGSRLALGAELDLWRQPALHLDVHDDFNNDNRFGMNAGLYGDFRVSGDVALTGKLAAKTPGYVMAQPVAGGVHGYVGATFAWR